MSNENTQKKSKRSRILKWVVGILLTLLVVLGITAAVVIAMLDRIAETGIRVVGSEMVGTKVDVNEVNISLLGAALKVNGFRVGNPAGFRQENAIRVKDFHVDLDVSSLTADKIVVDYLEVSGVELDVEYNIKHGLNLDVLLDNVKKNTEKLSGGKEKKAEKKAEKKEKDPQEPQKQVVIRKLKLKDIKFTFSSQQLNISMPLPLPDIEMDNVGEGKSLAETVETVLTELINNVWTAVKNAGKDVAKQVDGALNEGADALKRALETGKTDVGQAIKDGKKDFKNIFDKSKDQFKDILPSRKKK